MQQYVREMVQTALESKELAIQHVREPGQGKPVRGVIRSECPVDVLWRNSAKHVGIVSDVLGVIKIDKIKVPHLAIGNECCEEQGQIDPDVRA